MADEHSFDVTCKVDLQEVSNSINQTMKEISQRFDFKGSKSDIELDKGSGVLTITSDDEYKLKNVLDILETKMVKRGIALKAVSYGNVEPASGSSVRQKLTLQQGIPTEKGKEIAKFIKDMKMKVNTEIQGDQLRVKAKKIDDLQEVISKIKDKDFDIHIQITNYR